jgi:putative flavoprotein involved in K+ transport
MARALVCGAGAAGLGTAACLQRAGIETVVLERGDAVGTSWRRRYPALRLNTLGWMSTLPGYRASRRRYGEFPTRDEWVRYLEDYARHQGLEIRFGVEVTRVDPADGAWGVQTSDGSREATFVVVATGFDHDPYVPDWPGRDMFAGELIHASEYHDPEPFRGRDVLVIGASITGTELAAFVANGGASRVRLAMRTPPNIVPRKWLGLPLNVGGLLLDVLPSKLADANGRLAQRLIYGDLSKYGLPFPPLGMRSTLEQRLIGPAVDAGFVEALKQGRIEVVSTVAAFEDEDVVLADGSRIQPDAIICATGYRRGLRALVGHLSVLDEREMPRGWPTIEVAPEAPNLFFVGYSAKLSGQLRQMRFEARRVARAAKRRAATGAQASRLPSRLAWAATDWANRPKSRA